ncbi:hypothetical protein VTJ83DRAFT_6279 [Remersonia thermophila]|uniref:Uncharacterized protein n=1 Tax=Remersonia thermophila TaxID=72144 RepID=A0ABR4D470_9PEZI
MRWLVWRWLVSWVGEAVSERPSCPARSSAARGKRVSTEECMYYTPPSMPPLRRMLRLDPRRPPRNRPFVGPTRVSRCGGSVYIHTRRPRLQPFSNDPAASAEVDHNDTNRFSRRERPASHVEDSMAPMNPHGIRVASKDPPVRARHFAERKKAHAIVDSAAPCSAASPTLSAFDMNPHGHPRRVATAFHLPGPQRKLASALEYKKNYETRPERAD